MLQNDFAPTLLQRRFSRRERSAGQPPIWLGVPVASAAALQRNASTVPQASLDTITIAQQELSSLKGGKACPVCFEAPRALSPHASSQAAYVQVGRVFFKTAPASCAEKLKGARLGIALPTAL